MAKYVTRTSKYTEAIITVFSTKNTTLEKRITFVNGWYKNFEKGGDGWNAINENAMPDDMDILVQVNSTTNVSEKRKMTMSDWLKYSVPCNDDEIEEENDAE